MGGMRWPLTGAILLVAFLGATLWADRLAPRWRGWPVAALAVLLGALAAEGMRFDHGQADTLFWVGWVAAPLVAIFGGAAWGARRWYGWPDLGVHPPRAALVALGILVGVLVGSRLHAQDVAASRARLDALLAAGAPPARLAAERSQMGWLDPPRYRRATDADGRVVWGFPAGGDAWLARPADEPEWRRYERAALRLEDPEP